MNNTKSKQSRFSDIPIFEENEHNNPANNNLLKDSSVCEPQILDSSVCYVQQTNTNILPLGILNLSLEEKIRCLALAEEKLRNLKKSTNISTHHIDIANLNDPSESNNLLTLKPIPVIASYVRSSKKDHKSRKISLTNLKALPTKNTVNTNDKKNTDFKHNEIVDDYTKSLIKTNLQVCDSVSSKISNFTNKSSRITYHGSYRNNFLLNTDLPQNNDTDSDNANLNINQYKSDNTNNKLFNSLKFESQIEIPISNSLSLGTFEHNSNNSYDSSINAIVTNLISELDNDCSDKSNIYCKNSSNFSRCKFPNTQFKTSTKVMPIKKLFSQETTELNNSSNTYDSSINAIEKNIVSELKQDCSDKSDIYCKNSSNFSRCKFPNTQLKASTKVMPIKKLFSLETTETNSSNTYDSSINVIEKSKVIELKQDCSDKNNIYCKNSRNFSRCRFPNTQFKDSTKVMPIKKLIPQETTDIYSSNTYDSSINANEKNIIFELNQDCSDKSHIYCKNSNKFSKYKFPNTQLKASTKVIPIKKLFSLETSENTNSSNTYDSSINAIEKNKVLQLKQDCSDKSLIYCKNSSNFSRCRIPNTQFKASTKVMPIKNLFSLETTEHNNSSNTYYSSINAIEKTKVSELKQDRSDKSNIYCKNSNNFSKCKFPNTQFKASTKVMPIKKFISLKTSEHKNSSNTYDSSINALEKSKIFELKQDCSEKNMNCKNSSNFSRCKFPNTQFKASTKVTPIKNLFSLETPEHNNSCNTYDSNISAIEKNKVLLEMPNNFDAEYRINTDVISKELNNANINDKSFECMALDFDYRIIHNKSNENTFSSFNNVKRKYNLPDVSETFLNLKKKKVPTATLR